MPRFKRLRFLVRVADPSASLVSRTSGSDAASSAAVSSVQTTAETSAALAQMCAAFRGFRSVFEASIDTVHAAFRGADQADEESDDLRDLVSCALGLTEIAQMALWFVDYSSTVVRLDFGALR